ncbi:hypothetical protein Zmor_001780 [Zophobas morio]|uniref:Uncharacterized protein n=1 Tax=Zophobas morio TaxID=2755281 RepID=A0AA38J3C3_9CUCU|nr:hypothetical protein Zmor_001780 [Zophobas morio]
MVAAPGTRSVVGDDGGDVCSTGHLDGATLEMTMSAMRHRGPGQCDPGDDVVGDAAKGTWTVQPWRSRRRQCGTGDLDSATLEMMASTMRHRGPRQCDPGDDVVEAAQGTVKQCSPGDNLEAAQGTVKQCSPGDDLEAAQGTVKQCSPGEDIEAAQGTENGAALVKTRRGLRQCSP